MELSDERVRDRVERESASRCAQPSFACHLIAGRCGNSAPLRGFSTLARLNVGLCLSLLTPISCIGLWPPCARLLSPAGAQLSAL